MASITRYVVVDDQGNEGDWEYNTMADAIEDAPNDAEFGVIERVYEYDDSSLVFTSTGADTWPPNA